MRTVSRHAQFKKDVKRMRKRGKNMTKLKDVLELLIEAKPLPPRLCDHALSGNYAGRRDCHIEPDWLLIYQISEDGEHLRLERTGTHSDLFR